MMKKIYISGPMTGIEEFNKPLFDEAEKQWREREWLPLNPFSLCDQYMPYREMLGEDLKQISYCDALAVLPGWTDSKGARIEVFFAVNICAIPIYDSISGKEMEVKVDMFFKYTNTNADIHINK